MPVSPVPWAAPIGRFLLAAIFVMSGVMKLQAWQQTAQAMADKGLPAVDALLSIVVGLELVGGVLVILGLYARWGALALIVFLVPVTVIMHNFWSLPAGSQQQQLEMSSFTKNLALVGALLFVMAMGAGPYSIDALRQRRRAIPNHAP